MKIRILLYIILLVINLQVVAQNVPLKKDTIYEVLKLENNLDSLISTKSFGPISLKSFSNLQTSNISLMEDKRLGLNINIDFKEENKDYPNQYPNFYI